MLAGNRLSWLIVATALYASSTEAQTNERTYEAISFKVVTPGARAVAMGKSFVGIADDATAAASNPAGLSNLLDPEVSFEWSGTTQRQTRMLDNDPLDTLQTSITFGYPSFASAVFPVVRGGSATDVTVGFFYNSLQATKEAFNLPNGGASSSAERGYRGDLSITGRAAGFAIAGLLSSKVSVGGALTLRVLSNATHSYAYSGTDPNRVRNGSETDDTDFAIGGQFGVLLKPSSRWSVGGAFHGGSSFDLNTRIIGVFCPENCPDAQGRDTSRPVEEFMDPNQVIQFRLPTRVTGGVAFRPSRGWRVLADVGWIRYSERITPHFLIVDFLGQPRSSGLNRHQYYVNDAIELHGGVEYRFVRNGQPFAIRFGGFSDPEHQMLFRAERNQSRQAMAQATRFNTYRRGPVGGVTAGGGWVLDNRYQLDAAFSWSPNATELVISTVVRFPR